MGKYGRIIFWVALLILFNFAIFAMYKSKIPTESNSHVTFSNDVKLSIRIAHSSEAKAQGLMWVESMPMDHGMIFVYDPDKITNFWMKNTIIPLDMIFIGSDMQIKTIHTGAIPMDESFVSSQVPIRYVIEVNSGYIEKYNITTGMSIDIVSFPADIDINLNSGRQESIATGYQNQ